MTHDRDELAEAISDRSDYEGFPPADEIADALWSAGWRKKPSREAVAHWYWVQHVGPFSKLAKKEPPAWVMDKADAILALLDGPTETGEK